jgi:hypothetical protein
MLENGETIRRRMVSSELDVHHFQRTTVEEPLSLAIERIYNDELFTTPSHLHLL